MNQAINKSTKRDRRRSRIRSRIFGTSEKPRLSVFKSNTSLFVQLIDDENGVTLASAKGTDAKAVGEALAKAGSAKGIGEAVFDRGGYLYTGKVKAIAESARANGLKF